MKSKILGITIVLFATVLSLFAQGKTEKFKAYGNCEICKNRIEMAAKSVEGVTSAKWDKENKMIDVALDESKTDVHKIHLAISNAGHDTDMHNASDEAFNNLPGCCQYERKVAKNMKMEMKGM